jgi:hypothetical protein
MSHLVNRLGGSARFLCKWELIFLLETLKPYLLPKFKYCCTFLVNQQGGTKIKYPVFREY